MIYELMTYSTRMSSYTAFNHVIQMNHVIISLQGCSIYMRKRKGIYLREASVVIIHTIVLLTVIKRHLVITRTSIFSMFKDPW